MSVKQLFNSELKIINMGLESFYEDLKKQSVPTIQVEWKPKAGGNARMVSLLDRLKGRS